MEAAGCGGSPVNRDIVRVLGEDECWSRLRAVDVGRLAVAVGGDVEVFPLNHVVHDGAVVVRTCEGTKLLALVVAARVAFEVDGYDTDAGEAWSVVLKGDASIIERFEDIYEAQGLPLFPWNTAAPGRFVRIVPRMLSGRHFVVERPSVPAPPT